MLIILEVWVWSRFMTFEALVKSTGSAANTINI
ncbi:MAG: hypothetical protein ACI845_000490 [Gammaproteobacteria bacterium]|jgi:hypothetical protein